LLFLIIIIVSRKLILSPLISIVNCKTGMMCIKLVNNAVNCGLWNCC